MSLISSALPYASLLSMSSATTSAQSGADAVGSQLLAAVAQSQSASGVAADPLLQDTVSLSPAALGQSTGASLPSVYNAQGLLAQVQQSMLANDPLLQSDGSSASSGALAEQAMLQAAGSASGQTAATSSTASSSSTTANTSATTATATTGAMDLNANWAQVLKQNPSLAGVMVQAQMDQSVLSIL